METAEGERPRGVCVGVLWPTRCVTGPPLQVTEAKRPEKPHGRPPAPAAAVSGPSGRGRGRGVLITSAHCSPASGAEQSA